jgi:tetratricopeptide (TPR) repeat protein
MAHLERALALALVLAWAPAALAQGRDPAAAEALFTEGRKAFDAGDYAIACARFAESQRLDPAVGTLINLAACSEKLGKLADAWETWQRALRSLPPGDERRAGVEQRAAAIDKKLPRLAIRLSPNAPAGAKVVRDGVTLGSASYGVELPVDPGDHEVTVVAPGHKDKSYKTTLAEGAHEALDVEAGEEESEAAPVALPTEPKPKPAPPPKPQPKPAASSSNRTLGWVLVGVGGAGLALGSASGYLALSKKNTMDDDCETLKGRRVCGPDGLDAADSGKTWATVSTVAFAAGAAALGVGAYVLLTSPPEADTPNGAVIGFRGAF